MKVLKTIAITTICSLTLSSLLFADSHNDYYENYKNGTSMTEDEFNEKISEHSNSKSVSYDDYKNNLNSKSTTIATETNTDIESVRRALITGEVQTVNGYFINYGKGGYDWAYVTSDGGTVVKLDGMNSNGSLQWTTLHSKGKKGFGRVNISNDGKNISFEADNNLEFPGSN